MGKELFNVLEYIVVAVIAMLAMLVFFYLYGRHLKKKEEKMFDYDSPFPTSEKDMKVVHKKKRSSTGSAYRDRKRG